MEIGASSLDDFAACPARWFRRQQLGIPETAQRPRERARAIAAARGRVIHGLLEDEVSDDRVARRDTPQYQSQDDAAAAVAPCETCIFPVDPRA